MDLDQAVQRDHEGGIHMERFFRDRRRPPDGWLGVAMHDAKTPRRQEGFAIPSHAVAARVPAAKPPRPFAAAPSGEPPSNLLTWYLGLIPLWTGVRPRVKARLLLRTHQWITERVLAPDVDLAAAVADLRPDGDLARILTESLPAEDAEPWRRFIRILAASLRRALLVPVTRRNEAWVRWLFLVPYGAAADLDGQATEPGEASERSG